MKSNAKPVKGRTLKANDTSASLLSFTMGASKKESPVNEVIRLSKSVIEKFAFLVGQHNEFVIKSQKQLYQMTASNKEKLCQLYEILNVHKILMEKSQMGLNDASFLAIVCELTETLDNSRSKIRNEAKKYSYDNKELKTKLTFLVNRLIQMQGYLEKTKEESFHWATLSKIRLMEGEAEADRLEADVWDSVIHPEHKDPKIPPEIEDIQGLINESKVNEAIEKVKIYIESKKAKTGNEAGVLSLLAKRCLEENDFEIALEIINLAIASRKESLGVDHPYVANTITAKAIIYGKNDQFAEASKAASEAVKYAESNFKTTKDKISLGRQYMISGFFLAKWKRIEEGVKLMDLALLIFESLLPEEEPIWMDSIIKMARTCNDCKLFEDAMLVCCDLVDYFHESRYGPITKKNSTIYEVAADCQRSDATTSKLISLSVPKATYLPPLIAAALREMIIVFSSRYEFGSAAVVEKYLNACLKLDDPFVINCPLNEGNEMSKEVKQNIVGRRSNRQNGSFDRKNVVMMDETSRSIKSTSEKSKSRK